MMFGVQVITPDTVEITTLDLAETYRRNSFSLSNVFIDLTSHFLNILKILLEKIVFPTKGTVSLEFENNDYGYAANIPLSATKNASGLRIKKITYKDDSNVLNDVVKSFSYVSETIPSLSSGVVPFEPVYNCSYLANSFNSNFWMSEPILPAMVGYSQVTETNEDGSKTIYRFNSPIEYPPVSDVNEIATVVHIHPDAPLEPMLFKKIVNSDNPYLKTDDVNTHYRGLLKEKLSLDNDNRLLKKEEFTYQSWNAGKLFYFKNNLFDLNVQSAIGLPDDTRGVIFFLKGYINIDRTELSTETIRYYKPGDISNHFAEIKSYQYNSFYYPREIQETRSDGRITKYVFTYPTDYNTSAMNGVIENLNESILARGLVIESMKIVDGKVVSGSINEYDSYARIAKILNLETDGKVSYSSSLLNPANHISLPSFYKERYRYRYKEGRLVESTENGIASSWIWGYANSKVIAKAINASADNIYYDGFEDSGTPSENAKTGSKVAETPVSFSAPSGFVVAPDSKLTYWYWEDGQLQWKYKEVDYSGEHLIIYDGIMIDDIRIVPKKSHMTFYNHDGAYGVSDIVDPTISQIDLDMISLADFLL